MCITNLSVDENAKYLNLERKIIRDVSKQPCTSAKMIVADLETSGVKVLRKTVARDFYCGGLQGHRLRKKTLLQKGRFKVRLNFAHAHLKAKNEFWKTVLWSDDIKLELFGHMDVAYVWRKKGRPTTIKIQFPQ